jgi:hypothetical protein
MPIYVEKMMEEKDRMMEYDSLIDVCVKEGVGSHFKNWKMDKLKAVVDHHSSAFEQKGVALFLSLKSEYVSHGQHGGHYKYFCWLEFLDSSLPNSYCYASAASEMVPPTVRRVSFRKTELILYKAWVYYLLSELSSCCFHD